jgi:hypothetical protein
MTPHVSAIKTQNNYIKKEKKTHLLCRATPTAPPMYVPQARPPGRRPSSGAPAARRPSSGAPAARQDPGRAAQPAPDPFAVSSSSSSRAPAVAVDLRLATSSTRAGRQPCGGPSAAPPDLYPSPICKPRARARLPELRPSRVDLRVGRA